MIHAKMKRFLSFTPITHKTLIDHYLRHVSGILLIDEPAQVWEQRHFDFPAWYRTIRELIEPKDVGEDYDSDVNPTLHGGHPGGQVPAD